MVVDEANGMVRQLFRLREDIFVKDKEKDPIEEEILSPSPINMESFLKYQLTRDLDNGKKTANGANDSNEQHAQAQQPNPIPLNASRKPGLFDKCKIFD